MELQSEVQQCSGGASPSTTANTGYWQPVRQRIMSDVDVSPGGTFEGAGYISQAALPRGWHQPGFQAESVQTPWLVCKMCILKALELPGQVTWR